MLNQWLCSVFNNTFVDFIDLYPLNHNIIYYMISFPATACSGIITWFCSPILLLNNCIRLRIDDFIKFFNFLEQLLYTSIFILKLLFHLLEFTLLIDAPDDLIDVQLKADVTHLFIDIAIPYDLRCLDRPGWWDILEFLIWIMDKLGRCGWAGVISRSFNRVCSWDTLVTCTVNMIIEWELRVFFYRTANNFCILFIRSFLGRAQTIVANIFQLSLILHLNL
jgi:hypothetical protein